MSTLELLNILSEKDVTNLTSLERFEVLEAQNKLLIKVINALVANNEGVKSVFEFDIQQDKELLFSVSENELTFSLFKEVEQ